MPRASLPNVGLTFHCNFLLELRGVIKWSYFYKSFFCKGYMLHLFNIILFLLTVIFGSAPLWFRQLDGKSMLYLLAFSGSFLLSITFLHLLPETFASHVLYAGPLLLLGFFVQLLIQRMTHGAEHGHTHIHEGHHIPLLSIFTGLAIHAFMEGLPLGFPYQQKTTILSLYMAITVHKLPEAMLVTSIAMQVKNKRAAFLQLVLFALITPFASTLTGIMSARYANISAIVSYLLPVVAGAFIHIATTIFFESGTKQHAISWQKVLAMVLGVGIGLLTLAFE